ncbi:MAG TPA: glycosyltransferase family 9 protein, partial [Geminicoccaceae bacterium]
ADAGNVACLLAGSGTALPEDPDAWAAEVRRLTDDPAHHAAKSAAALRNAARLSSRHQTEGFARLFAGLRRRILVAVGSGAGNLCHQTPVVRRLAEHYGAPVDVLVNGDFPGCAALFRGAPWVAAVYETPEHVLPRTYDLAVVTQTYGRVLPPISARRIVNARDVAPFDPCAGEHEVDVNLRLLERGLGVPIRPEDRQGYFLGAYRYRFPASRRVALHAGCKGGAYLVKRWPHFAELAGRLTDAGYTVVSVGVEDEYVPGTIRAVGGTFDDTIRELLGCDALISNDSGIMNLANALGMPTVAFFGPSSARVRGPVHAAPALAFQAPLACSPCEERPELKHRFTEGLCTCIGRIGLDDVAGPILAFLARLPEGAATAEASPGRPTETPSVGEAPRLATAAG